MNDLLAEAEREIRQKHREQIEEETAYKWAARAVAAYRAFRSSNRASWLRDSENYYNEAIEHGALADPYSGAVLRDVIEWIHNYIPSDTFS
jgi:hypothetical protein